MSARENSRKRDQLRAVAESYFRALKSKDFGSIPYDENVRLRAPLAPGGVNQPLVGKQALQDKWWQPLQPALEGLEVRILGHYLNDRMNGIITEAEVTIMAVKPPVTLRVADRFTVNDQGKIVEQENHFDPRDITEPGWQNA